MTDAELDSLAVLEEQKDTHGNRWLICRSATDAPRPFVVLVVRKGESRAFARWAGSESQARAQVADFLLTSRAIENVPMHRRASPTKAAPR